MTIITKATGKDQPRRNQSSHVSLERSQQKLFKNELCIE